MPMGLEGDVAGDSLAVCLEALEIPCMTQNCASCVLRRAAGLIAPRGCARAPRNQHHRQGKHVAVDCSDGSRLE